jgi:nickel-type superoxide dismutase maturation protease
MRWPLWRVAVVDRSMQPALHPGDWLLVWRGTRPGQAVRVRPGQLVIARHPARPDLLLVKRAGRREPGGWWLAADNLPAGAADSRTFGVVADRLIEGRGLVRYRRAGPGNTPR